MIKFFRQIRQRLLTKNKINKYLLYALGEIVLVMIGILLALQINNWNTEKKDQEKIQVLLGQMSGELNDQIDFYQKDSVILQSYISYLTKVSDRQFDQIDLKTFLTPFGTWVGGAKNFDTALNGLINQGIFDKLANADLKKIILKDYFESQNELKNALEWNSTVIVETIEPFINENLAYRYRNGNMNISEKQVLTLFEASQVFRTLVEFQILADDFALTNITSHLSTLRAVKHELTLELNGK